MTPAPDLPPFVAAVVGVLAVVGAAVALLGTVGLLRLKTFYDRVHPPTLTTSLGLACVVLASMVTFTVLGTRLVVHEILLFVFVTLTLPVTMMLLARAALFRDRAEAFDETLDAGVRAAAQEEAAALAAARLEAESVSRAEESVREDEDAAYGRDE